MKVDTEYTGGLETALPFTQAPEALLTLCSVRRTAPPAGVKPGSSERKEHRGLDICIQLELHTHRGTVGSSPCPPFIQPEHCVPSLFILKVVILTDFLFKPLQSNSQVHQNVLPVSNSQGTSTLSLDWSCAVLRTVTCVVRCFRVAVASVITAQDRRHGGVVIATSLLSRVTMKMTGHW